MQSCIVKSSGAAALLGLLTAVPAAATPFFFSTGNPDGKMATVSHPESPGVDERESADDFVLTSETQLNSATVTGLVTGATPTIAKVVVELYHVFPKDSTDPPDGKVPTRVNSPSDKRFDARATDTSNLTFSITNLAAGFTAANSVLNGINPSPHQTTGGEGPVTGEETQFNVTFTTPFDLPADHYFFVPQVEVTGGEFFWLSAPRPIAAPGTPFPAGFADLQEWIREDDLKPDWLRVGSDIVGPTPDAGPMFNATFSISGDVVVPEPASVSLLGAALAGLGFLGWRRGRRNQSP